MSCVSHWASSLPPSVPLGRKAVPLLRGEEERVSYGRLGRLLQELLPGMEGCERLMHLMFLYTIKLSRCVARQLHTECHQGATYLKPRSPNSWSPSRGLIVFSFSISCHIIPTCPIWVLCLIPMAWKRHLWSTDLTLFTLLTSSISIACPLVPTCPIWALYLIPMA